MSSKTMLKFDEVGYWSEMKLQILEEYASAYSRILGSKKQSYMKHIYIDAFAGAGKHKSRATGKLIPGSPLKALSITPPFKEYHLIDLDGNKIDNLKKEIGAHPDVRYYHGNSNHILINEVIPTVKREEYKRGLCLLDPYGLHLNWEVIKAAANIGTIEILLNFPTTDMNRNVFWRNPEGVDEADIQRMDNFWGDHTWRDVAYTTEQGLFGPIEEKTDNTVVVESYVKRLKDVAKFTHVAQPMPMYNKKNAVIYYLIFASQNATGKKIMDDIFNKYRNNRF